MGETILSRIETGHPRTRSGEEVWRHPGGGTISLSEGMLLRVGRDNVVTGIDLGPSR